MSEWAELGTKTGQRGLLIASYQRLEKRLDGAMTAAAETVCVPAHLARQGFCKPSSCATFTHNSHWGRAATGKVLRLCVQGSFGCIQLFVTL